MTRAAATLPNDSEIDLDHYQLGERSPESNLNGHVPA